MSPEYYWSRVFEFPLNSKKEVLRVLPNEFDEYIDIEDASYYVQKLQGQKYLCFAYDESKIIEAIKNSGLKLTQVNNIHFGQIEFGDIVEGLGQSCMKVDNVCLSFIDGKLVQIPLMLQVDIENNIDIQNIKLSKESISLNSSSKYIQTDTAYKLTAVFVLFSLFTFVKVIDNKFSASEYETKIENIKTSFDMPATTIQTKSIMRKLQKISTTQNHLRETASYIFDLKRKTGGTILSLDIKDKNIKLKVKDTKAKKLTNYLEKKYTLNSAVVKDSIVTVGFKYE